MHQNNSLESNYCEYLISYDKRLDPLSLQLRDLSGELEAAQLVCNLVSQLLPMD